MRTITDKMQMAKWSLETIISDPGIKELEYEIIQQAIDYLTMMLGDRENTNL